MRTIKFRAWDKENKKWVGDIDSFFNGMLFNRKIDSVGIDFWSNLFELSQFTGLLDKNGTEIYEGDILQSDDEKRIVVYVAPSFELQLPDTKAFAWDLWDGVKEEIIGNIYENPELLSNPVK